jgi:hypothetical protein
MNDVLAAEAVASRIDTRSPDDILGVRVRRSPAVRGPIAKPLSRHLHQTLAANAHLHALVRECTLSFKTRNMRFRRGTRATAAALLLPLTCASIFVEIPSTRTMYTRDLISCDCQLIIMVG